MHGWWLYTTKNTCVDRYQYTTLIFQHNRSKKCCIEQHNFFPLGSIPKVFANLNQPNFLNLELNNLLESCFPLHILWYSQFQEYVAILKVKRFTCYDTITSYHLYNCDAHTRDRRESSYSLQRPRNFFLALKSEWYLHSSTYHFRRKYFSFVGVMKIIALFHFMITIHVCTRRAKIKIERLVGMVRVRSTTTITITTIGESIIALAMVRRPTRECKLVYILCASF